MSTKILNQKVKDFLLHSVKFVSDEVVNITYVLRDGTEKKIRAKVGDNVMYLAHRLL